MRRVTSAFIVLIRRHLSSLRNVFLSLAFSKKKKKKSEGFLAFRGSSHVVRGSTSSDSMYLVFVHVNSPTVLCQVFLNFMCFCHGLKMCM